MHYKIQRGVVEIKARSPVDDTTAKFSKLEGTIDFDPDAPEGASVDIRLDMRVFDAGDTFKNWKIKGDLEADANPTATFILARFEDIHEPTAGQFVATATGQIKWRDHAPIFKVKGKASVDRRSIDARASFDLDLRQLGIGAAKFGIFRADDLVAVQVSVFAFLVDK